MCKKTFTFGILLGVAFAVSGTHKAAADYDSDVYNSWRASNGSYGTLKISDTGYDAKDTSLSTLFQSYFGSVLTAEEKSTYTTSNALWEKFGVKKDVKFYGGETATLEAAYKNGGYQNTISLTEGKNPNSKMLEVGSWGNEFSLQSDGHLQQINKQIDLSGISGEFDWSLYVDGTGVGQYNLTSGVNSGMYGGMDGIIHMLVFDVTDFVARLKGLSPDDTANSKAYMIAWEDISHAKAPLYPDFDYQDFVAIFSDIRIRGIDDQPPIVVPPTPPTTPDTATPEPATMLLFGTGLAMGLPLLRNIRRKKSAV
ncbi:MAG: PEP-CTERM sorting domain-containing protein [Planctomycetaceae bacterium]|jgi:hypothetical protein|nr:PEP-CTERM sorting domain-containing protein [Planctomycetaceae bacterium]